MAELQAEVERVVREVLAKLGQAVDAAGPAVAQPPASPPAPRACDAAATAKPTTPAKAAAEAAPAAADALVLTGRVVSLADLDGRLGTVRRVLVAPGAIVTPAVRDELLRRNIVLGHTKPAAKADAAALRLCVMVHGGCCEGADLASAAGNATVELAASDCVIASSDRLAAAVAEPNTLGVLATRHTAAGLCLANRLAGVRAVLGHDPAAVARDTAAVGGNVLVVDPRLGTYIVKKIIGEFCRGGVRPCPAVFAARLS